LNVFNIAITCLLDSSEKSDQMVRSEGVLRAREDPANRVDRRLSAPYVLIRVDAVSSYTITHLWLAKLYNVVTILTSYHHYSKGNFMLSE